MPLRLIPSTHERRQAAQLTRSRAETGNAGARDDAAFRVWREEIEQSLGVSLAFNNGARISENANRAQPVEIDGKVEPRCRQPIDFILRELSLSGFSKNESERAAPRRNFGLLINDIPDGL